MPSVKYKEHTVPFEITWGDYSDRDWVFTNLKASDLIGIFSQEKLKLFTLARSMELMNSTHYDQELDYYLSLGDLRELKKW